MFGKCLKYEIRAYSRLLVPTFIAFMIAAVLMSAAVGVLTSLLVNPANDTIQVVASILLYLIIMVLELSLYVIPIMVFVLTIRRFYTSFFTDEGYLTFTLPVSVDCHLTSKLVAAAIADIFGIITAFLTVIIIASGAAIANFDVFKEIFFTSGSGSLVDYGLDSVITLVLSIVAVILGILGNYLLLYLSISLGCMLAKKHRLVVCGACYLGVTTVVSTISVVISIIVVVLLVAAITSTQQIGLIINIILSIVSVFLAIQVVVCYFITRYILKNKVNLD